MSDNKKRGMRLSGMRVLSLLRFTDIISIIEFPVCFMIIVEIRIAIQCNNTSVTIHLIAPSVLMVCKFCP